MASALRHSIRVAQARSDAVAGVLQQLRDSGRIPMLKGWRSEGWPVKASPRVARCAGRVVDAARRAGGGCGSSQREVAEVQEAVLAMTGWGVMRGPPGRRGVENKGGRVMEG